MICLVAGCSVEIEEGDTLCEAHCDEMYAWVRFGRAIDKKFRRVSRAQDDFSGDDDITVIDKARGPAA